MILKDFLEKTLRLANGWAEHESASWTMSNGFCDPSIGPNIAFKCRVEQAPVPKYALHIHHNFRSTSEWPWWKWEVTVESGNVHYTAEGYEESRNGGKDACLRALRALALAVFESAASKEAP